MKTTQLGAALLCLMGVPTFGWAETIRFVPADRANYAERSSRSIRRIVIHTTEGSEAGTIAWFQDPRARVSAHYLVARSGRITQMVDDHDLAYHAGNANGDTIGIECEGYAARDTWTEAQLRALEGLVADLVARYGIAVDRAHLVGHSEVASHKSDPGPHFDWDRLLRALQPAAAPAADARHVVQPGETLAEIADRWQTTVADLVARNGLADPDLLDVGQELRVGAPARDVVAIASSALNVRAAPWGDVLGQASRDQRFAAGAGRDGWRQLAWRGGAGWVSGGYLRAAQGTLRWLAEPAAARARPSARAAAQAQLEAAQAYVELGRDGAWVLLQVDHRALWVAASSLN